jgi:hypothetical protein
MCDQGALVSMKKNENNLSNYVKRLIQDLKFED